MFAVVLALIVGGCSATADAGCAPPATTDVSTPEGWIGYLATHRDDVGLSITPLEGAPIRHNDHHMFPTASSIKLVHLAVYAESVAAGKIRPDDTVTTADWERWYMPLDGGAHVRSLDYLGIPAANGVADDRSRRVSYRELVDVMIRFSDSAAPDLLRERLGDKALREIMERFGMTGPLPSLFGMYRTLIDQSAGKGLRNAPTITATPASLHALTTAIADGSLGAGAVLARQALEFQGPNKDGSVLEFKGGSLPFVLTENFEYRTTDHRIAVASLMVKNLSPTDARRNNFAHQRLLLGALTDEHVARQLRCIL